MSSFVDDTISIGDRGRMVDYVLSGRKPKDEWRTGLEIELIGYERGELRRIGPGVVEQLLREYSDESILENGLLVGANAPEGSLTVEPGGQVEFSGAPERTLQGAEQRLRQVIDWLAERAQRLGIIFIGVGFDPVRSLNEQRWLEKPRYAIMRPYLQGRDQRGLDMMTRTASIQVNLDFESEADMARKFVAGNRLAPIVSAIFANSPFREGRLTGMKSERALVWMATDNDRCGVSPAALSEVFAIDEWLDGVLRTPMFFTRRGSDYKDQTGRTFARFLEESNGEPVFADFVDHLTTVFTEARLKKWLEMRSADGGDVRGALAVQALWKGLLYHKESLDEAFRLMPVLSAEEYLHLQLRIAKDGLFAQVDSKVQTLDLARDLTRLAVEGLKALGDDEQRYLDQVQERLEDGLCPADILIRNFEGMWQGHIGRAIDYLRVA